jgi:hypothetical protein
VRVIDRYSASREFLVLVKAYRRDGEHAQTRVPVSQRILTASWVVITATVIAAAAPPLVLGAAFAPSNFIVAAAIGAVVGAAMLTGNLWIRLVLSSIALVLAYGFVIQLGSEGGFCWIADVPVGCIRSSP